MPPFDFPNAPTVGQVVTGPGNIQYKWDGTKWVTVVPTGGGGSIVISDTAPSNPSTGNLWFDSVGLQTYIWYTDPTSSQWTPVTNQSGLLTDAPSDGNYYSRHNGTWSSVAGAFLPLTGGTLTGPLTINTTGGAPTSGLTINGWQTYVDSNNVFTIASASTTQATLANTGNFAVQGSITANRGAVYASSVNNSTRGFLIQTLGSTRWYIYAEGSGETGSNAGSNFQITGYTDAGVAIGNYLTINRATGSATFSNSLAIGGQGLWINGGAGSNCNIFVNKASGTASQANYIFGQAAGLNRWVIAVGDAANEGGSNTGSNFDIYRYPDGGGGAIDAPLSIARTSGVTTFSQPIVNGSDLRQKRDVSPISDALALIKQLVGVSYERTTRPGRRELGLIAQDVRAIVPEAVEEVGEPVVEGFIPLGTADNPMLGISYTQFTALLIEAIKELSAKVEALEAARVV